MVLAFNDLRAVRTPLRRTLLEMAKGQFTQDIGDLFEAYVGLQLQQFPDAEVIPEITYDADNKRSVDWIVIWDDLVILVEAKATRLGLQARMGTDQLLVDLDRTLGKANRQIKVSSDCIRDGHAAFAAIPDDRPLMGLVVTLEPYFHVNSSQTRALLPDPGIPTIACSARELEQLVTVGMIESASALLHGIAADAERYTFDLVACRGPKLGFPSCDGRVVLVNKAAEKVAPIWSPRKDATWARKRQSLKLVPQRDLPRRSSFSRARRRNRRSRRG